ncbi:DNA-binding protein [Planktothrix sp. FACHB-1355]|uniref:DNA-binding protein n=1 Tax=Aerosakkonema funiforme FACHB-1375 TaxID=2949571 RepID=A0A926VFN4_9CYAN|nr:MULTISPECIES: HIRAN domain-containing protein [Oscillatoriales]MBD2181887.1 DNA-binding protein [Aerosakkonema funiforme FACHB-1375]MBD3557307.1 DNA-binding protein [Planktothrix sp. FACHB-1355]
MNKPKTLFLAWQDPNSRSWFPIGRLTFDGAIYQFVYTQGAKEAQEKCGFQPLLSFPRLDEVYTSTHLFSVFSNRLMPRSRPDYSSFIQWLNIPEHEDDPIAMLARSGGQRETDTLTVFPCPAPDEEGRYHLHFFSHGLRHLPQSAIERINRFEPGDKLWLAHEFQNSFDSQGLTLNTEDRYIVGYCPRYLNSEIFELLRRNPRLVEVRVERANQPPTPLQFRLLCNLTARWSEENLPFSGLEYQPLIADAVIAMP